MILTEFITGIDTNIRLDCCTKYVNSLSIFNSVANRLHTKPHIVWQINQHMIAFFVHTFITIISHAEQKTINSQNLQLERKTHRIFIERKRAKESASDDERRKEIAICVALEICLFLKIDDSIARISDGLGQVRSID